MNEMNEVLQTMQKALFKKGFFDSDSDNETSAERMPKKKKKNKKKKHDKNKDESGNDNQNVDVNAFFSDTTIYQNVLQPEYGQLMMRCR